MKYDTTRTFQNAIGKEFLREGTQEAETFAGYAAIALLADINGSGEPVRGPEKLKRFDLWLKIKNAGPEVELSSEEVSLLGSASEIFTTALYGQMKYYLEQKA